MPAINFPTAKAVGRGNMDRQIIALLREGRSVAVTAEGRSMHPFLRPGDTVVIRPLDRREEILAGELILAEQGGGRWALHRAIRTGGKASAPVVVKGDALLRADLPVERESVAGKAAALKRPGGREYALESASARRMNAIIALFSLWETRWFRLLPAVVRRDGWLPRLIRSPKWFLIRILYP